jgi:hypothetical protein
MQPSEVAVHEAGAEADGLPLLEVVINALGAAAEAGVAGVEASVVIEVMNAHLKASGDEPFAEVIGDGVSAFGNKVKGGSESGGQLQLGEGTDASQAIGTFDIVRKDEGEFVTLRPTGPIRRRLGCRGEDGPMGTGALAGSASTDAAKGHAEAPRQKRLEGVVEPVAHAYREGVAREVGAK